MAERHALVIDADRDFRTLVERALTPFGFRIAVVDGSEDGLDQLVRLRPEIVFAAVELPERAGFRFCHKARSVARGTRIVLATSTIPWREMEMHHKLKVHADLYLDKRQLNERELLSKVETLLGAVSRPESDAEA